MQILCCRLNCQNLNYSVMHDLHPFSVLLSPFASQARQVEMITAHDQEVSSHDVWPASKQTEEAKSDINEEDQGRVRVQNNG